ncbi:MAG: 30S ribosomal protein S12 methylthiotransferase RimO [Erysipelotrichaceae bacterium]|nr:30S ribosomal protein S12 methylthiotransferase RimO [Erysipelotrichaceae bacterium]
MLIGLVSLGCCKNLIDTQNAMSFLQAMGHEFTDKPERAECIIVNTCGFINDAKQESIDTILEMAQYKEDRCRYLVVMGCLVQRYREDLEKELPEVDLFISISEYGRLPEIFGKLFNTRINAPKKLVLATAPHTAYLRIADGCSNRCSYCAIPLIRGDYKSRPIEEIIEEAKQLKDLGVKELNLIAQDTSRYGIDNYDKLMLSELLKELNELEFDWIRILYMYPDEITDELLDTMASLDHVLPYFDIPVQYGNDRMLKLMNRRGSASHIKEIVAKIRSRFEDPVLRTTLIVGFPTETEDDFNDLMEFIKETRWDHMGAFVYSREEDTTSYDMQPQVEPEVANKRLERLMALQQQIVAEDNRKLIGKTLDVLIEGKDGLRNIYEGRSKYHAPDGIDGHVRFESDKSLKIGEFVKVMITEANVYDLHGEYIEV